MKDHATVAQKEGVSGVSPALSGHQWAGYVNEARGEAVVAFVVTSYITVLPLTAITLRLLRVPEHLELVAGSLLVVAYGMLSGALISAVV